MATYLDNDDSHSIRVELALNGFVIRVGGKILIASSPDALQKILKQIGTELIALQKGTK